jgi:hypothetical protein
MEGPIQALFPVGAGIDAGLSDASFRFLTIIRGSREILPRIKRIPLNIKGPTYSIPLRCATKAKPQMQAVSNKSPSARIVRLFIPHGSIRGVSSERGKGIREGIYHYPKGTRRVFVIRL